MLHHITGKRHGEVVAQPFVAKMLGKQGGVVCPVFPAERLEIRPCERVSGIQHPEEQFVPFISVLAE